MPRGFTLLETLLFIGASSVIVMIIAGLLHLVLVAQTKQTIVAEINETGARALSLIARISEDSKAITEPIIDATGSTLTLSRRAAADTPTILEIVSSTLRFREGAQSPLALHSSHVSASSLTVVNLSPVTSTPGIFDVRFTLSSVNPSSRPEYEYSRTFQSSISLH